jgi:hypothetical protein
MIALAQARRQVERDADPLRQLIRVETAMSLSAIITRRREALIKAWKQNPLILVQVESPQALPRLAFIDVPAAAGTLGALGQRDARNVAVVRNSGDPDANASVWVAARYSSYKSAYVAFINSVYDVKATASQLGGFDIDHLLNRARSPQDSTFIRIEAVPDAVNQAWGRLFEKASSNPQFFANQRRERRTMSWMICAKLAGEMPPTGPNDSFGIDRLVSFFRSIGLAADEAREGLTQMLTFAYKFRSA